MDIKRDKKLTVKVINWDFDKEDKINRFNSLIKYNGQNKIVLK